MKRAISVILVLLMLSSCLTVGAFALTETETLPIRADDTYTPGDVNRDGAVNALDAQILKTHVLDGNAEISVDAADLNADTYANARDVLCMKAIFAEVKSLSDYDNGEYIYSFKIAGEDISGFDFILPADTDAKNSNAYLSAEIFRTYIEKATGYAPEIVMGESSKPHGIYYHQYEYDSEEALALDLGLENYIYKTENGDLHIYASVRGSMYATYELIEKYLGFRFFNANYTFVYRHRAVNIPEDLYVFHEMPIEFRFIGAPNGNGSTKFQTRIAYRENSAISELDCNKQQGYSVGMHFIAGHSFGYYKGIQAAELPEGDADLRTRLRQKYNTGLEMIPDSDALTWQPCASSDEEYYRMFNGLLEVTEMLQNNASHNYTDEKAKLSQYSMTFSINDNLYACTCKTCNAKINGTATKLNSATKKTVNANYTGEYTVLSDGKYQFEKESISGLYLDLMNRAVKEIRTEYHGYDYEYGEEGDFTTLYRVDDGVRKVYPDIHLNSILYDHTLPESVMPEANLQLIYVSHGCNNHFLGSGDCGDNLTPNNDSNKTDEYVIPIWAERCKAAGSSLWYYSWGVSYGCHTAPAPNVMDFYWNAKYLYENGVTGICYEGGGGCPGSISGRQANFEGLKTYLVSVMSTYPTISYEEFCGKVKEYLYMYYGKGYEEIWQYLQLQTECGDAAPCWINNHGRPFDLYEPSVVKEKYAEMRGLLDTAVEKAQDDFTRNNCRDLYVSCDFLGLSVYYNDWYVNGTAAEKQLYIDRYTEWYEYMLENGYTVKSGVRLPATIDFSDDPVALLNGTTSWRGIQY